LKIGRDGRSSRTGLPPPKETEALSLPADQRFGSDDDESVAPVEPPAEECEQPARRRIWSTGSHIPLLVQRKLAAQEEDLGFELSPRPQSQSEELTGEDNGVDEVRSHDVAEIVQ
jgi:hypothetical protein